MSHYMEIALTEARNAATQDEVPVGAVIVERATGNILARAHNLVETQHNPLLHAEMLVITEALAVQNSSNRLSGCDLHVTLEPCPMCAGAISHARIDRVYFGAYDPKSGGVAHGPRVFESSSCHHKPEVIGGVLETECGKILSDFFASRR